MRLFHSQLLAGFDRRTFRFTIRDLLWLTLVVALTLAWWLSYSHSQARINGLQESMENWRGIARNKIAEVERLVIAHGGTPSKPDEEVEVSLPAK